jgi:hypothetical protein
MNWNIELAFHWPHDRFTIGWEYMCPDEEYDFRTIKIFLLSATITFNF